MRLREYTVEGRVRSDSEVVNVRLVVAASSPAEALERARNAHIDLVNEYDLDYEYIWEVWPL